MRPRLLKKAREVNPKDLSLTCVGSTWSDGEMTALFASLKFLASVCGSTRQELNLICAFEFWIVLKALVKEDSLV